MKYARDVIIAAIAAWALSSAASSLSPARAESPPAFDRQLAERLVRAVENIGQQIEKQARKCK